jgi:predicted nucleic acid-binding protein
MVFVDTSFLVAFANPSDVLHVRARKWTEWLDDRLLTTDFVLCEFVNLLSKSKDRLRVRPTLQWLDESDAAIVVEASRAWFNAGMDLHNQRADKEWSLTDCISFEVMRAYASAQALSHDHHFEQAGFDALLRRDPPS